MIIHTKTYMKVGNILLQWKICFIIWSGISLRFQECLTPNPSASVPCPGAFLSEPKYICTFPKYTHTQSKCICYTLSPAVISICRPVMLGRGSHGSCRLTLWKLMAPWTGHWCLGVTTENQHGNRLTFDFRGSLCWHASVNFHLFVSKSIYYYNLFF